MPPRRELEVVELPVEKIHPNPWNPNVQSPSVAKAERESLETFGVVDPVKVRPHPEIEGEWQIVDGEHRFRDLSAMGEATVQAIVLDLDDAAARKLTIVLNETRGDADVAGLGKLLVELEELLPADDLALALPYSKSELDHLLSLGRENWDDFGGQLDKAPREGHTLAVHFDDDDLYAEVLNFLDVIEKEGEVDRPTAIRDACRMLALDLRGEPSSPD